MWMSQHSFSMQKQLRQIADMKFECRNRFYYEFWRFNIENDHHYCIKYENSLYFSFVQIVFAKSFEDFRTRFFLTMLISSMREFISFEISTFKNAFLISRNSFDNFDDWEQRKLFFRKKKLFSLFNDFFFEKKNTFLCFSSRHFDSIFRLSQKY
jgi:hypothetical protein